MTMSSVLGYGDNITTTLQEAIQLNGFAPDGLGWFFIFNGFLVQGSKVAVADAANQVIPFVTGFDKQVLGVWIQPINATPKGASLDTVTLAEFTIHNSAGAADFYWWAIGV